MFGTRIILAALILGMFSLSSFAQSTNVVGKTQAAIVSMSGTVEIAPAKSEAWEPARLNKPLSVGDRIRLAKGSRAALRLPNGNILRLSEATTYSVPALTRPSGE